MPEVQMTLAGSKYVATPFSAILLFSLLSSENGTLHVRVTMAAGYTLAK